MKRIDELYTEYPFYGSRRMTAVLNKEGHLVNRKRVIRLMRLMGLDCIGIEDSTEQTACEISVDQVVAIQLAENTYDSATSLGGRVRLRPYSENRYRGAHTLFYGTEFRWNLTDESTPFNLFLIKDLRTGIQLAFFHEEGSVAEEAKDLFEERRTSTGAGIRMVTSSEFVYRFDLATGQEGTESTLFIEYPWEDF